MLLNLRLLCLIAAGFCLWFAPATVFAQTASISGKVISNDGPIEYAHVSLSGGAIGAITDSTGHYTFSHITPGEHRLRISAIGFATRTQLLKMSEGEHLHDLVVRLEEASSVLDEVVVTGTMQPTFVKQSPIKVDVITLEHVERFLPSAGSSIMDNLKLVNGIQEVVACGVCYTNSISINGLPGPYTAVLMDGMPMYGNLASVYGLNGIPNMIIDRVEVIKGPSSTLYGSEALAGVINIITKDPAYQPALSVDIMGTSHLESFGNVSAATSIGKSHGFTGLNYAYINDFDDANNDGFGDGVNLDRYALFTKWNIHRPDGRPFTLAAKYYYEDRRNGVEEFLTDRNYRTLRGDSAVYGESIYTTRVELFGTYALDTEPDIRIDFSFSHHDQDSYYGIAPYRARQQIAFANGLWNIPADRHQWLIGVTARFNGYDDNSIATERRLGQIVKNAPSRQFIPGIFVQDAFEVSNHLTILSGVRLDHYEKHGMIFSPRISARYAPSEWSTFRINTGTGFRIVNLFTEDHAFVTGQREVEIRNELQPEKSFNISLNFNHVYTGLGGSGSLDLEGYYTYFNNKITPDYDTPGKIIYDNSSGHALSKGVSASITHRFTFPLGISLAYNIQRVTETEIDKNDRITSDIEFAPRWSGIMTLNYSLITLGIDMGCTVRTTGAMALPTVYDLDESGQPELDPRPLTSRPFSLLNFQASKAFGDEFSVYLGIQNLMNYRQDTSPLTGYNDPVAPIGFSDYFDTSYAYAPNHGREFYIGFKWELGRVN